jgi:hypothetical protein
MKKIILMLLISASLYGQKHDNIWPMGYKYDSCNYYIDFTDSFEIVPYCLGLDLFQMGNSAISDSTGKLLFYTNGNRIADSSHQIMLNGTGLNNTNYSSYATDGYPAKTLILPKPNSSNLYYIFHQEFPTNSNGQISYGNAMWLNYSLVDMTGNGGLGEVVLKNVPLINDTIAGSGLFLNANKHADGVDWWILVPGCCSMNKYYRFLLTEDSILGPYSQEVPLPNLIGWGGQSVFSPDGSLYARYGSFESAYIYDFNRCTGELSFKQEINPPIRSNVPCVAISPNSRYLYLANDTIAFQYDLAAADINASRITVAVYNGFISPFPVGFWQMQLAPNGKIYGVSSSGTDQLHVIENPDYAGLACNFRQHAIITPRYNGISLPNFPHFRTPALAPGACDTTGVLAVAAPVENIKIYPNPANDVLNLEWDSPLETTHTIQVLDLNGRLLQQKETSIGNSLLQLNTTNIPVGFYILRISDNVGNIITNKKILILR